MQHNYFSSFKQSNHSFVALLLLWPTSFLKLPNKILVQTEQRQKIIYYRHYIFQSLLFFFIPRCIWFTLWITHLIIADTCIIITSHKNQCSHDSRHVNKHVQCSHTTLHQLLFLYHLPVWVCSGTPWEKDEQYQSQHQVCLKQENKHY